MAMDPPESVRTRLHVFERRRGKSFFFEMNLQEREKKTRRTYLLRKETLLFNPQTFFSFYQVELYYSRGILGDVVGRHVTLSPLHLEHLSLFWDLL